MLKGVFSINTGEFCIVDYLEDVDINFELLKTKAKDAGYELVKEMIIKKEEEETYEKFVGKNYIGYIFKK